MINSLMVQGTTSDAGKSTLVAGLCRLLMRRGIRVAPFKPQNMALNSAVTADGGEIGRAQALQAFACGIEPRTDMNPVLLKPSSDRGSQVIIHGRAVAEMDAKDYHAFKPKAMEAVLESYQRLVSQYDLVLVEGAGSPAEINLRENDIANMGFAEAVDCPVLLVADIDRGGVFAHLVGTLALLSQSEQERVQGLIINRFRGDVNLLQPGINWLEQRIDKPTLGVLPYLSDLQLEAEDSLNLKPSSSTQEDALRVVIPRLPRISNHTDFDPLRLNPSIDLRFVDNAKEASGADLIILPGTKSVRSDLQWLLCRGWEVVLQRHLRYGGKLLGICGGFQMLGKAIHDPQGIEGSAGSTQGLGFLAMETTLEANKQLHNVNGELSLGNVDISGYEIHAGISSGEALASPLVKLADRNDGAISEDGQVIGSYLHGLFESKKACEALLAWSGLEKVHAIDFQALRNSEVDRLADTVEQYLDIPLLNSILSPDMHVMAAQR